MARTKKQTTRQVGEKIERKEEKKEIAHNKKQKIEEEAEEEEEEEEEEEIEEFDIEKHIDINEGIFDKTKKKKIFWKWANDSNGKRQNIWSVYDKEIAKKIEFAFLNNEKKFKIDDEKFVDFSSRPFCQRRFDNPIRSRLISRSSFLIENFNPLTRISRFVLDDQPDYFIDNNNNNNNNLNNNNNENKNNNDENNKINDNKNDDHLKIEINKDEEEDDNSEEESEIESEEETKKKKKEKTELQIILEKIKTDKKMKNFIRKGKKEIKKEKENFLRILTEKGFIISLKYLEKIGVNLLENELNDEKKSVLLYAARFGKLDILRYLIEEKGGDKDNSDDFGRNLIMVAARYGQMKVVKYLHFLYRKEAMEKYLKKIKNNNNLNNNNNNLNNTKINNHQEENKIKILNEKEWNKQKDEDEEEYSDMYDNIRRTPLFYASFGGHFNLVKFFVNQNTIIQMDDDHGVDAIDVAKIKRFDDIGKYLTIRKIEYECSEINYAPRNIVTWKEAFNTCIDFFKNVRYRPRKTKKKIFS